MDIRVLFISTLFSLVHSAAWSASNAVLIYPFPDSTAILVEPNTNIVLPDYPGILTVCPAHPWDHPCIDGAFEHSHACAAITDDCNCYEWLDTKSNSFCVNVEITNTSLISLKFRWQLMRIIEKNRAIPAYLAYQYADTINTFPTLDINTFLETRCAFVSAAKQPPPCIIDVSFTVLYLPAVDIPQPPASLYFITLFSILLLFCLVWFISHPHRSKDKTL